MRGSQFSAQAGSYFKVPDFELDTLLPHNSTPIPFSKTPLAQALQLLIFSSLKIVPREFSFPRSAMIDEITETWWGAVSPRQPRSAPAQWLFQADSSYLASVQQHDLGRKRVYLPSSCPLHPGEMAVLFPSKAEKKCEESLKTHSHVVGSSSQRQPLVIKWMKMQKSCGYQVKKHKTYTTSRQALFPHT